ncbi:hypothetical protein NIG5292_02654 [Nereida ignava]|uniref:Uncharacterized protein n=1 Tax=Nereida ignava TaxID=282199 RepID=A0A0U1NQ59_9RHOB|nr:hypothetical protein [Nereida ignava]CRK76589.1 hypothetical protein NIG5292_02654 [Nereida ignava]SFJ84476.1 hypothetical protein SAMN02745667_02554 [Nereida ignava DSM 16309]
MKWTFAWTIVYGRSADKTDLGFPTFADAASVRSRDKAFVATQRMSPNRSFTSIKLA